MSRDLGEQKGEEGAEGGREVKPANPGLTTPEIRMPAKGLSLNMRQNVKTATQAEKHNNGY